MSPKQFLADEIIRPLVREQQSVSCFVGEDVEPREHGAHRDERNRYRSPVPDAYRRPNDRERRRHDPQHCPAVAQIVDDAKLGPELRVGPTVGSETVRPRECVERAWPGGQATCQIVEKLLVIVVGATSPMLHVHHQLSTSM